MAYRCEHSRKSNFATEPTDIVQERLAPTDQELASDDALDAWLWQNVTTSQHISGTCKMGPALDPLAVVD